MKVLVIGASGNIGSGIVTNLACDTEVITVNHSSGDYQIDLADPASIVALFKQVTKLDAIVCAASRGVVFKPLTDMTAADYQASLQQKLLGQLTVAIEGIKALNDNGSITLTTGVFNRDFVKQGTAAATINNAVEGFVRAASLDLPRGIRINAVSPALLDVSAKAYAEYCPGFNTVSTASVAKAYRRSIYGIQTGQVFEVA
ncbi:MAG: short chain dehydrogenase [Coxiella sp. (in: Bacteria)]|nr:MAG: short chain dehydrogenase [Coxiella sp. (in: g-proteobacteria)]